MNPVGSHCEAGKASRGDLFVKNRLLRHWLVMAGLAPEHPLSPPGRGLAPDSIRGLGPAPAKAGVRGKITI